MKNGSKRDADGKQEERKMVIFIELEALPVLSH